MVDKLNVPPPTDEEQISYIYNPNTQMVHKWPGCKAVAYMVRRSSERMKRPEYWTPAEFAKATRERGAIRRCRLCFGRRS